MGVVNIDAHLDVRPLKLGKAHSGSPFRLLIEDERFNSKNFAEFAAQGNQCSAIHANYVKETGGRIIWLSEIRREVCVSVWAYANGCSRDNSQSANNSIV